MIDAAIMLAKIFGPLLAILGLWTLLYGNNPVKVVHGIKNSAPTFCLTDVINLLIGLAIINLFNSWILDKFILVTLLGWIAFLWGLIGLFLPHVIKGVFMSKKGGIKIIGIIGLLYGLALVWVGFWY